MQFKYFFILAFITLIFSSAAEAQEIKINEKGEKIVVFPDGTWIHLPEKSTMADSLNTQQQAPRSEEEERSWKEELAYKKAVALADQASVEKSNKKKIAEDFRLKRILLEDELDFWKNSTADNAPRNVAKIEKELSLTREMELASKEIYEESVDWHKLAVDMIDMSYKKRKKKLAKIDKEREKKKGKLKKILENKSNEEAKENEGVLVENASHSEDSSDEESSQNKKDDNVKRSGKKVFAKYNASQDVLLNPPPRPCQMAFDGVDEFSGKARRDVQKQAFFTYTPEQLRPHYKNRDLLVCEGSITASRGYYYLNLYITINSKTANRSYGMLEKGSVANLKLINGENIRVLNSSSDPGSYNPVQKAYIYRGQYPLDKGIISKLKKSEVDKIRLFWSSGYEDYEVYELDFFRDQFKCLEQS